MDAELLTEMVQIESVSGAEGATLEGPLTERVRSGRCGPGAGPPVTCVSAVALSVKVCEEWVLLTVTVLWSVAPPAAVTVPWIVTDHAWPPARVPASQVTRPPV